MNRTNSNAAEIVEGRIPTRVGVGLVRRGGRFLARVRPEGAPLPGHWEFPGGKCEPGESPEDATRRECREELGMSVVVVGLRGVITHGYAHALVELHVFDCVPESESAEPAEGTGFHWETASMLARQRFPEANAPLLEALAREFPEPEVG